MPECIVVAFENGRKLKNQLDNCGIGENFTDFSKDLDNLLLVKLNTYSFSDQALSVIQS